VRFFDFITRYKIAHRQGGKCYFAALNIPRHHCEGKICDFHHIVSKTQANIKKYGVKRIHSAENCAGLCRWCHNNNLIALQNAKIVLMEKWDKEIRDEQLANVVGDLTEIP